jgi:uncharacterized membrane protein
MEDNINQKNKEDNFFSKTKMYINLKLRDKYFMKGFSTVIGACLMNFITGSIYSVCQLVVYEISYIKHKNTNSSITNINLTFYYPIETFFKSMACILSGVINKTLGLHYTNAIGIGVLFIGYSILFLSSSFFVDMIGIIFGGMGAGLIYYPSTANACEWFMDHNGIVIGIIETVISLGSFFFNLLGEKIINPDNIESVSFDGTEENKFYPKEIAEKFKAFMLYLIVIVIILYIISFFLTFKKKRDYVNEINESLLNTEKENGEKNANNEMEDNEADDPDKILEERQLDILTNKLIKKELDDYKKMIKKALKSRKLLSFILIALLQSPVSSMVFALYRAIGENNSIKKSFLTAIGPVSFIFECLGGFIFGVLCDYIPKQKLLLVLCGSNTFIAYIYCITFKVSSLFFLSTIFISFNSGSFYSVKDCFILNVFGVDLYVELISFVEFCNAILVIVLAPITYWIEYGMEGKYGGYWIIFVIFGTFSLISFILSFYIKDSSFDYDNTTKSKEVIKEETKEAEEKKESSTIL